MSVRNLEALFAPRSVVVVGASDRAGTVGATVWRNLSQGGLGGRLLALTPAHRELGGVPVFARCADLPEVAELAVFLASDRSKHISGTPIWIDGAQSLLV